MLFLHCDGSRNCIPVPVMVQVGKRPMHHLFPNKCSLLISQATIILAGRSRRLRIQQLNLDIIHIHFVSVCGFRAAGDGGDCIVSVSGGSGLERFGLCFWRGGGGCGGDAAGHRCAGAGAEPVFRLAARALFAVPAVIVGYALMHGLAKMMLDPGLGLTALCSISGMFVGIAAVANLAVIGELATGE